MQKIPIYNLYKYVIISSNMMIDIQTYTYIMVFYNIVHMIKKPVEQTRDHVPISDMCYID